MAVAWALNVWATNSWVGMNGGPPNAWRGASTPVPVVTTTTPGGVRKGRKREVIVRLSDVQSRADTAEFLKAQLLLRHPDSAFKPEDKKPPFVKLSKADRARQAKLSADALKAMQIEAENEQRTITDAQNNAILTLLLIGSQ